MCSVNAKKTRPVTDKNRMTLKAKIKQYHDLILHEHVRAMSNTVSIPSAIIEFGSLQMQQVLDNCHKLFSLSDVTM